MLENQKIRPAQVIGPLGEPLTLDSLPPASTTRWVVRRKAEVVAAVNGGLLTIDEVLERYNLTLEEFAGWQRAVDRSGMQGLRVTRIQDYRDLYERQLKYCARPARFARGPDLPPPLPFRPAAPSRARERIAARPVGGSCAHNVR